MSSDDRRPPVAVIGVHHTPLLEEVNDESLEEMIFAAAKGALSDATVGIEDIDAVVLATSDQVHGRVIESMVTAGAAGGVGRDVTTMASAGEHALVYGYLRLLAGQSTRVLVLGWGKPSESVTPEQAELVSAEPFLLRPVGMNLAVAAALQANTYRCRYGVPHGAPRAVRAAREAAHAAAYGGSVDGTGQRGRLIAWPLGVNDLPRPCDAAIAIVLARSQAATEAPAPAWIRGAGWSSDRYDLGSRDLSRFEALEQAGRRAVGMTMAVDEIDVVEVQEISTVGAFAAAEALGLAGPGLGATSTLGGWPRVNPSGGNLPADPGNASGLIRLACAANQARGRAGRAQIEPRPALALGAALHGFAGQAATVMLFGRDPEVS